MRFMFTAIVGAALCGCVAPYVDEKNIATADPSSLCLEYHRTGSETALAEVKARAVLNEKDLGAIEWKQAAIGMSQLGVQCFYGRPESINSNRNAHGRSEQWVYCSHHATNPAADLRRSPSSLLPMDPLTEQQNCGPHFYVYFTDGIVDTFQNEPPPPKHRR